MWVLFPYFSFLINPWLIPWPCLSMCLGCLSPAAWCCKPRIRFEPSQVICQRPSSGPSDLNHRPADLSVDLPQLFAVVAHPPTGGCSTGYELRHNQVIRGRWLNVKDGGKWSKRGCPIRLGVGRCPTIVHASTPAPFRHPTSYPWPPFATPPAPENYKWCVRHRKDEL